MSKNVIFLNDRKKEKASKGKIFLRIFILLLFPIALILKNIAANNPEAVEKIYSRGFYPAVSGIFSKYFNIFPFSAVEIIIYCLIVFLVFLFVVLIKRLVRKNIKGFFSCILAGLMILTSGYFVFIVGWGLNYYRNPLEENLGYKTGNPTAKELSSAIDREINEINSLSEKISYDKNGESHAEGGFSAISKGANEAYINLLKSPRYNGIVGTMTARPKPVIASELMAYNGIEGIFVPFTYEANVNISTPDFIKPFNAAHECAHLKGFAREQEANFVSYLALCESDNVYYRYSAHMSAYMYLAGALYETDSELWKSEVSKLSKKAAGDFVAYQKYIDDHAGKVAEIANNVNDSYLKAQGQQGVITYDMFTKLLCDKLRSEN